MIMIIMIRVGNNGMYNVFAVECDRKRRRAIKGETGKVLGITSAGVDREIFSI